MEVAVYVDGIPPVIHRAYVMAYEASGRFTSNWVVSQVLQLVPYKGRALFFVVNNIRVTILVFNDIYFLYSKAGKEEPASEAVSSENYPVAFSGSSAIQIYIRWRGYI